MSALKPKSVRDLLGAHPRRGSLDLGKIDPCKTHGLKRDAAGSGAQVDESHLMALQDRLYAAHQRSLLIILQGMDTAGKDGAIRHILRGLNPQGVRVISFKAPTPTERAHDFLWRIRPHLPKPGEIVIFNRSYFEDVLIAKVHELAPPATIDARYDQINRFEASLAKRGITIVKLFLHISAEEQRGRLLDRLGSPDKHWKISNSDIAEHRYWNDYQQAYATAIARCSTPAAPWHIVPSDRKWYRNWAVSQILIETLDAMQVAYPPTRLNVRTLKKVLHKKLPLPAVKKLEKSPARP